MYKTLNPTKEQKCKKFLHELARDWITEWGYIADSSNNDNNVVPSEKRPKPRGPSEDPPGDLSTYKLGKILCGVQGKKKYGVSNVRFVLRTKSGVKQDIFVSLCCATSQRMLF
jgi:hypothetical protein